ncbi:hypothetical protein DIC66_20765 [Rhodoferax lacus]|uniref:Uncharacterized protein n=1 Tax=Rhodoferax lacus TaxID=2184758 RepID=A0A3E1R736_9BURK|nr:hypothetical protein [Rhodoferax lacus]RFO95001.1 hypothetical protein DIC66_20765 [Rhodoferax lacus]
MNVDRITHIAATLVLVLLLSGHLETVWEGWRTSGEAPAQPVPEVTQESGGGSAHWPASMSLATLMGAAFP